MCLFCIILSNKTEQEQGRDVEEINERGNKEKRTEEREKEWEEERHYCNFLFTKSATQEL